MFYLAAFRTEWVFCHPESMSKRNCKWAKPKKKRMLEAIHIDSHIYIYSHSLHSPKFQTNLPRGIPSHSANPHLSWHIMAQKWIDHLREEAIANRAGPPMNLPTDCKTRWFWYFFGHIRGGPLLSTSCMFKLGASAAPLKSCSLLSCRLQGRSAAF